MPRRYNNYNRRIKALARRLKHPPPEEPQPKPVGRPRHERRLAARLARIPQNRRCPECERVVFDIRKWSIPKDGPARCRSCTRRARNTETGKTGRSRAERRLAARLEKIPADRTCPSCGRVVLEARRWAVSGEVVECLGCRRSR